MHGPWCLSLCQLKPLAQSLARREHRQLAALSAMPYAAMPAPSLLWMSHLQC